MTHTDYRVLIERARSGEQEAVAQLLQVCRLRLKQMACGAMTDQFGPDWDRSDAVQETLLEAHRGLAEFRGREEEALFAWLRAMLNHNLVDRAKYHNRLKRKPDSRRSLEDHQQQGRSLPESLAADQSSISERMIRRERQQQLARALSELPEQQANVFCMRHLQGLSLDEIAKDTGRSRPAVAGLLIRATRQLHQQLSREVQE